jgi:hypothetical protein
VKGQEQLDKPVSKLRGVSPSGKRLLDEISPVDS